MKKKCEEKTKLVCLGDSIGTNYKLKVRSNTFSDLLGRRLGLEVCNYSTPAITAGMILERLSKDEKMIQDVKDALIVVIAVGSNNLLRGTMQLIAEAAGIEQSMRMVNKIVDAIKRNPAVTLKMITAMNSQKMKDAAANNVASYKTDIAALIDRIHELNSKAIILAPTLYTMNDIGHSFIYSAFSKPTAPYFDEVNEYIRTKLPAKGVIVIELAQAFRNYDGDEDLSNLKENDFHLSDFGHIYTYRQLYDHLIDVHPELACQEGNNVIEQRKVRKTWKKEDGAYGSSKYSPIVREIVEKNSYNEIKDYDENKQFAQMGVSGMEIFDIGREIEKTVLDNKTEIPIPFSVYIKPTYFTDYLDGKMKPSILERLDKLPHYASQQEKAAAIADESETMHTLRNIVYELLNDDMLVLDRDTICMKTLDMDLFTWTRIINRIETITRKNMGSLLSGDMENVSLGQIADHLDNA